MRCRRQSAPISAIAPSTETCCRARAASCYRRSITRMPAQGLDEAEATGGRMEAWPAKAQVRFVPSRRRRHHLAVESIRSTWRWRRWWRRSVPETMCCSSRRNIHRARRNSCAKAGRRRFPRYTRDGGARRRRTLGCLFPLCRSIICTPLVRSAVGRKVMAAAAQNLSASDVGTRRQSRQPSSGKRRICGARRTASRQENSSTPAKPASRRTMS